MTKWTNKENSQATEYKIIYKELTTFDNNWRSNVTSSDEAQETLIVSGNATEKLLGPLKASTMYEVTKIMIPLVAHKN